jgi:hypothetical protein
MDLVKTNNVNHIKGYINTNKQKTTANTTKYIKQVWNKVRTKNTVNVCQYKACHI